MARRLNTKLAIIGLLFVAVIILGAVVYYLKSNKDPKEFFRDGEAKVAQINALVAELQAKGDYSDEAKESVKKLYTEAQKAYGTAYNFTKDPEKKVDILFTLADFHLTDNPYHEPSWQHAMARWNDIVTIDTENIKARQNIVDYYRVIQKSISQLIPGGDTSLWAKVEEEASELAEVMKETGQEVDGDVLKLKGWAIIELADSGQVSDPEVTVGEAISLFESMVEKYPKDVEVYEYLARAYFLHGRIREAKGITAWEKAREKQKEILEKGLANADDKAGARINLLAYVLSEFSMDFSSINNKLLRLNSSLRKLENELLELNVKYPEGASNYSRIANEYVLFLQKCPLIFDDYVDLSKNYLDILERYSELLSDYKNNAEVNNAVYDFYITVDSIVSNAPNFKLPNFSDQIFNILKSLNHDFDEFQSKFDVQKFDIRKIDTFKKNKTKFDKSFNAIRMALKLDTENLNYAYKIADLYFRDAAISNDIELLNAGIDVAKAALEYPDARDIPGPKRHAANMYRNVLYRFLAKCHVEQAIYAKNNDDASLEASAIENAEKMVYEIKQIIKADDFVFQKWDGLLAMIKEDNTAAIRNLYNAQQLLKATGRSDSDVSYYLSKLLAGNNTIGAREKFLGDALINKNGSPNFTSIAGTKPEAMLEYAEVLLQLGQFEGARSIANVYNERYSPSIRSKTILINCDIYSGVFDDAVMKIADLEADASVVESLELALINRRIQKTKQELKDAETSNSPEISEDDVLYIKQELNKFRSKRKQLIVKLIKEKRDQEIPFPNEAYEDLRMSGDTDSAAELVNAYLNRYPDSLEAKVNKKLLTESDPSAVSPDRKFEIQREVYSGLSDKLDRNLNLAVLSAQQDKNAEAISYFRKALEADPDNRRAVGGLFDAALKIEDFETANEMLTVAIENNMDDCNGQFFAARLDFAKKSYQSALERLDSCIQTRPIFSYAYLVKSQVYAAMNDYVQAVESAKQASSISSLDGQVAKQLALVIDQRNRRIGRNVTDVQENELKNALGRAIALNPGQWQLQSIYANYMNERDPDNAIAVQQNLFKRVPNVQNAMVLGNMAFSQAEKVINKQKKQFLLNIAGPAYQAAYRMAPDDGNVLNAYAEFMRVNGDRAGAIKLLEGHDKLLANLYLRDGQFNKAKEILEKFYASDNKDKVVLSGLMTVSQKLANKEELKKYSEELIAVDPSIDNRLKQIQMYLDSSLIHEAELKLESFRARHPDEPRALLLEAWATMSQGKLDRALELVSKNLATDPDNAIAWRLRGQIRSLKGDYQNAIDDLVKSRSLDDNASIQMELANAYNRSGDPDKAIGVLAVALQDDRAPEQIRDMLESLYARERRNQDMMAFYKRTLYKYPQSIKWHFRAGVFSLQRGRFSEAEDYFFRALKLAEHEGGNLSILDGYLTSLVKGRKLSEAIHFAKQYTDTELALVAYLNIAKASHEMGNRDAARDNFLKAIEKSGNKDGFVLKVLEDMSNVLGTQTVVQWCEDELAKSPESKVANLMMYKISLEKEDFEKALSHIDVCLEQDEPESPEYIQHLALKGRIFLEGYIKTSKSAYLDSSIKVYENILEMRPNNSQVMNNLAYLLADNDIDLEKALTYAERAHKMMPNDANTMDTYAYVLCKTGNFRQAKDLLYSALTIFNKNDADISWDFYEHLAMAYEGLGQNTEAQNYYQQAISKAEENISPEKINKLKDAVNRVSQLSKN